MKPICEEERRIGRRRTVDMIGSYTDMEIKNLYNAKLRNISSCGISFQVNEYLAPGHVIFFQINECPNFQMRATEKDFIQPAEVVWSTENSFQRESSYSVGLKFLHSE